MHSNLFQPACNQQNHQMYPRNVRLVSIRRQCGGLSLIEVLVSIAIMTAVLLAMYSVIPYCFKELQVNATQVQAIALGQQTLDALRNATQGKSPLPSATTAPVDQGDSFISSSSNPASGVFTITPNTCPLVQNGGTINQYDCLVTVVWTENGANESIKVESYVTAP